MSVAGAVVPGTPRTVHGSHGNSRTERPAAVPGPPMRRNVNSYNRVAPHSRSLREEYIELTSEKKSLSCAPRAAR